MTDGQVDRVLAEHALTVDAGARAVEVGSLRVVTSASRRPEEGRARRGKPKPPRVALAPFQLSREGAALGVRGRLPVEVDGKVEAIGQGREFAGGVVATHGIDGNTHNRRVLIVTTGSQTFRTA
mgnify:CR=1 FL=1